jgi:hypothetical protein
MKVFDKICRVISAGNGGGSETDCTSGEINWDKARANYLPTCKQHGAYKIGQLRTVCIGDGKLRV